MEIEKTTLPNGDEIYLVAIKCGIKDHVHNHPKRVQWIKKHCPQHEVYCQYVWGGKYDIIYYFDLVDDAFMFVLSFGSDQLLAW